MTLQKNVSKSISQKQVASQAADDQLRAEIEQLRAEHAQFATREGEIMELLGTSKPERIIHDLRNLLNERELLKTLCDHI